NLADVLCLPTRLALNHSLPRTLPIIGQDGGAARHAFHGDVAERLSGEWEDQELRLAVQFDELRVRDRAQDSNSGMVEKAAREIFEFRAESHDRDSAIREVDDR